MTSADIKQKFGAEMTTSFQRGFLGLLCDLRFWLSRLIRCPQVHMGTAEQAEPAFIAPQHARCVALLFRSGKLGNAL